MEVTSSRTAFSFLRPFLDNDVEEFWVLALGSTKKVIRIEMIARGTVDSCFVHPRDVFRFALKTNASSLLVAHNHPSGDCTPSRQDLELTRALLEAGNLLQIPIVDHLVLAGEDYWSMGDSGELS
jgi:DNA repair protein RadC